ncbi:MAG: hypothetical protein LQ351_007732 [Letrouitia transgressa]|nr:MAG: hypothetical protein LQ351_007732 [Letrouitia transgressa]
MLFSTLFTTAVAALQLTPVVTAHAIPKAEAVAAPAETKELIPFPFDEAHASYIEDAFDTIASIPDPVFDEGEEAVKQWVLNHSANPNLNTRNTSLAPRQGWLQVAKCAYAIGKAIVENAIPLSKLRRIKELIGLLGGAKKVAKMLLKAKGIKEFIIIGGPELAELAEILLGIQDIVSDCFSF